jgi:glycosyltransferase involved in cell wall biosynthesis
MLGVSASLRLCVEKTMLIGIDASRAARAERTGTEAYSLHLIRAMLEAAPQHRFRLYADRALPSELVAPNAEPRMMPFPRLWTHARLSTEMLVRPPDVLFVPAHVAPLVHPRTVVTIHDLGYLYFPQAHPLGARLYLDLSTRWNARVAAHVITDSQATKDDLVRHYAVAPDKITVAYPGRDESVRRVDDPAAIEAIKLRYGIAGEYLLYVGTLQPRKNLVRLVQAFSNARFQISNLKLVIAGSKGWLCDEIFAKVKQLGLEGQVMFPGRIAEEDKAVWICGAKALVFPSLYEGFGLPVVEAMQCGTPVVCSNTSSLPEVVGDAALLVDPLDVDALTQAMARLLKDASLRRMLVERGYSQAQRFSWAACATRILSALESAVRQ